MNSKILELTVMETGSALATKLSVIYCYIASTLSPPSVECGN